MKNNIILIGFMGAGKSSVGICYAKNHGLPFIDTDQMIEAQAGMCISDIFEKQGEDSFRQLEAQVLDGLLRHTEGTVISAGGGLPLREDNRAVLRQLGIVIYLKVLPETVLERLEGDTSRPLLSGDGVQERVRKLLEIRNPVYTEASHYLIAVDGKTLDEISDEIERSGAAYETINS